MERAVFSVAVGREVEALGQLASHAKRVDERQRTVLAHHDVERVGGDVILREIRDDAVDAGRDGRGDPGMSKSGFDQALELADELMHPLRRQVEAEDFDRHQAIALRLVRAKHRPQSTGTDLMKYSKWTESVWRSGAGNFRVQ